MQVPQVTALSARDVFRNGRTAPLLIEAVDSDNQRHEVILKVFSSGEGGKRAAIAELVCSLIARELGLNAPTSYIVDVPSEFHDVVSPEHANKLSANPGPHFASQYVPGMSIVTPDRPIPSTKEEEAAGIFTFDFLVQNPDRRNDKPNLLECDEGYRVIDHDMALGDFGQTIIGGTIPPWEARAVGSKNYEYMERHLFRRGLKNKSNAFAAFHETMQSFDPVKLDVILDQVPQSWWDEVAILDDLKHYFENISTQATIISTQAQGYLPR